MKIKKTPQFLIGVPAGRIESMEASWAEDWINIYDNGGIGWAGGRMPTKEEKKDIKARIMKLKELMREREADLDRAWFLMGG
jgi:hypothetical protein